MNVMSMLFNILIISLLLVALQDLESDPKTVSFSKNGEDMGVAFEFTEDLKDKALFPHVVVKNAEFTVNFGSQVTVSLGLLKTGFLSTHILCYQQFFS